MSFPIIAMQLEDTLGRGVAGPDAYALWYDFLRDAEMGTTNWTYNVTNSTAATTVNDAKGGSQTQVNTAADNDRIEGYGVAEIFKLDLGVNLLFKTRVQIDVITQSDYFFGLVVTDTDYLGDAAVAADIIGFEKNDGDAFLDFIFTASSAAYTRQAAIHTMVANTDVDLAFYISMDKVTAGKGRIWYTVNGNFVNTNGQDGLIVTGLPTTELAFGQGVQNGDAAACGYTMNWIGCAQNRTSL